MDNREYDGMTPLADSDLVFETAEDAAETFIEEGVLNDDPAPVVTKERARRRRWSFSDDFMGAFLTEPRGGESSSIVTFDMKTLPAHAYAHLAAFGASVLCGRVDDPEVEFARLVSGAAAVHRVKAPPKVNHWRQSIALALVDATKKSDNPLTLDAATISASAMTTAQVKEARNDPKVVTHYRKLAGITSSVASIAA